MSMGTFLVSAVGFFNDAYDLFVMNVVNLILAERFGKDVYTAKYSSLVSTCVFIGSVLGQLGFGFYADQLGRRKIMIITATLLILGGLLCTCAYGGTPHATFILLAIFRGILGLGIGGEYPLSCTSTAESSTVENRGKAVSLTFSLQGVGQFVAAWLANLLVQTLALGEVYNLGNLDFIWRSLFAFGTIPAILILYPRYKAEESKHFEERVAPPLGIRIGFILRHYGTRLIGTAGSWFLFDIVFYANSIFSSSVLEAVAGDDPSLLVVTLQLVYVSLAALPGYFVAMAYIDKVGRKNMQLIGFIVMGIIFFILGIQWEWLCQHKVIFITLYGLSFFFSNFGPNTTTFLLPAESYPTILRATCHGFSAAMGKTGAIVGTATFQPMVATYGEAVAFLCCAGICAICLPLTWFFVQDRTGDLSLLDDELNSFLAEEGTDVQESPHVYLQPPVVVVVGSKSIGKASTPSSTRPSTSYIKHV